MNVLADVSAENMECLARASFEEVGFDRSVSSMDDVVRRALEVPDFKFAAQRMTLVSSSSLVGSRTQAHDGRR